MDGFPSSTCSPEIFVSFLPRRSGLIIFQFNSKIDPGNIFNSTFRPIPFLNLAGRTNPMNIAITKRFLSSFFPSSRPNKLD